MVRVFEIPLRLVARWAALPAAHGRAVRALLYGWLARGDAEFARFLHEEGGGRPKPFACSPLLGAGEPQDGAHLLSSEHTYSLEISALTERAAEVLKQGLPGAGEALRLGQTEMRVAEPPREVRRGGYGEMFRGRRLRKWGFRFLSPVVIQPDGMRSPLVMPEPRFLFSGLTQKWNAFAPEESADLPTLPPGGVRAWVEEHVRITAIHDLWTEDQGVRDGGLQGFMGEVEFAVPGRPRAEPWLAVSALVRLAPYAGIGGRSLEGAGRVEVIAG